MPTYREDNDPIPGEAELHIPELTSPEAAPRTTAGRALLATIENLTDRVGLTPMVREDILAIEAEAAAGTALDVKLIAAAIRSVADYEAEDWLTKLDDGDEADAIAAEYARLAGVES